MNSAGQSQFRRRYPLHYPPIGVKLSVHTQHYNLLKYFTKIKALKKTLETILCGKTKSNNKQIICF